MKDKCSTFQRPYEKQAIVSSLLSFLSSLVFPLNRIIDFLYIPCVDNSKSIYTSVSSNNQWCLCVEKVLNDSLAGFLVMIVYFSCYFFLDIFLKAKKIRLNHGRNQQNWSQKLRNKLKSQKKISYIYVSLENTKIFHFYATNSQCISMHLNAFQCIPTKMHK